jgi:hypothetical protein
MGKARKALHTNALFIPRHEWEVDVGSIISETAWIGTV